MLHWACANMVMKHIAELLIHLPLFRQNSASCRQFEGCPCVRGGSWSRGTHALHPQCRGSGPACGGEGYTLHPRAEGKLSSRSYCLYTMLSRSFGQRNTFTLFPTAVSLTTCRVIDDYLVFFGHLFIFIVEYHITSISTALVWGSTREVEGCPRWHTHSQNGPRIPSKYL